jgi:transaldolase
MDAFRDHGVVADTLSGAGAGADAKAVLDDYALMETGIEEVCARLEEEGVKSFLDSHRKLLAAVEGRLKIASSG